YALLRVLGKGASGDVHLAHDAVLGCNVAVKILNPLEIDSEQAWERFRREILLSRRLAHPGICRTFDLHVDGDVRFITMEYLQGRTLRSLLEEEPILAVSRAVF